MTERTPGHRRALLIGCLVVLVIFEGDLYYLQGWRGVANGIAMFFLGAVLQVLFPIVY